MGVFAFMFFTNFLIQSCRLYKKSFDKTLYSQTLSREHGFTHAQTTQFRNGRKEYGVGAYGTTIAPRVCPVFKSRTEIFTFH